VRSGDVEDKDTLEFRNIDDLESGRIEEQRSAGGLASYQRRKDVRGHPIIVKILGPRLERYVIRTRKSSERRLDFPVSLSLGR
jgi:hypothetical protein